MSYLIPCRCPDPPHHPIIFVLMVIVVITPITSIGFQLSCHSALTFSIVLIGACPPAWMKTSSRFDGLCSGGIGERKDGWGIKKGTHPLLFCTLFTSGRVMA